MTLFSTIKRVADKRGMSIKDLSFKAGLSEKAIYNWDTKFPKADNLLKVANVLGVSTDYLLNNDISENGLSNKQITLAMSVDPDITDEQLQQAIDYVRFMKAQEDKQHDTNGKD